MGALLGAILPRTEREAEYLGSTGHKLTTAARDAARTAADTTREQLDQVTGSVVNKVGSAVLEAVGTNKEG